jgi:hypothetical protein
MAAVIAAAAGELVAGGAEGGRDRVRTTPRIVLASIRPSERLLRQQLRAGEDEDWTAAAGCDAHDRPSVASW